MTKSLTIVLALCLALLLSCAAGPSPKRQVREVLPFPSGGCVNPATGATYPECYNWTGYWIGYK